MTCICWNRYAEISFDAIQTIGRVWKSKDTFCVRLVKLKITFRNTIFWSWIWVLINTNPFYKLELIELMLFSKNINSYNLGRNSWDKIENLKKIQQKTPLFQIYVVPEVSSLWQQNVSRFNIDKGENWEEFAIWKIETFLEFSRFSTFYSTRFARVGASF